MMIRIYSLCAWHLYKIQVIFDYSPLFVIGQTALAIGLLTSDTYTMLDLNKDRRISSKLCYVFFYSLVTLFYVFPFFFFSYSSLLSRVSWSKGIDQIKNSSFY